MVRDEIILNSHLAVYSSQRVHNCVFLSWQKLKSECSVIINAETGSLCPAIGIFHMKGGDMKEDFLSLLFKHGYEEQKLPSGTVIGGVNAKAKNREPPF